MASSTLPISLIHSLTPPLSLIPTPLILLDKNTNQAILTKEITNAWQILLLSTLIFFFPKSFYSYSRKSNRKCEAFALHFLHDPSASYDLFPKVNTELFNVIKMKYSIARNTDRKNKNIRRQRFLRSRTSRQCLPQLQDEGSKSNSWIFCRSLSS